MSARGHLGQQATIGCCWGIRAFQVRGDLLRALRCLWGAVDGVVRDSGHCEDCAGDSAEDSVIYAAYSGLAPCASCRTGPASSWAYIAKTRFIVKFKTFLRLKDMTNKKLTWLHISDIHIKASDPYDRDTVLNALVDSIKRFKARDICPDLLLFTGDVAFSGKSLEYKRATEFFERILFELDLNKSSLYMIPGNHDVDREKGYGLQRTLTSHMDSIRYFEQAEPLLHLSTRQRAYFEWYNEFFAGIRSGVADTTCGPSFSQDFGDFKIGIIPINTATFCCGDDDSGNLWIGRRCLEGVLSSINPKPDLTIALMHHPLDWLNETERTQITSGLYQNVDCILRGHLHQTEMVRTDGTSGSALHLAAGASYQGSEWPNKAMFVEVYEKDLRVIPIRFDDLPSPRWTIDTSIFPDSTDFSGYVSWRFKGNDSSSPVANISYSVPDYLLKSTHFESSPDSDSEELARKNFEQDLFVGSRDQLLYVEPRLSKTSQREFTPTDTEINFIEVKEIVEDTSSYMIAVPSEHGGSSLSKRLVLELRRSGMNVELRDATSLPNYRAKLRDEFDIKQSLPKRVLILDNYNTYSHEKMLKETLSLKLFERYIFISTVRGIETEPNSVTLEEITFKTLYLWPMARADIRNVASILIDTADTNHISSVVDKVYNDLLSLSIPLTPSNVVMYIRVLEKESDFHPFNRVDIVRKYLTSALSSGGELFTSSFNTREKIDILAEFSYSLFKNYAEYFSDAEWNKFCQGYMEDTLSHFSASDLLRGLEETRVLVRYENKLYFKYGFFFSFLVGSHIANHPDLIKPFVDGASGHSLYGVVETFAALSGDSTSIIDHLTTDLETKLDEFSRRYVPIDFDPMSKAEWQEEGKDKLVWEAVSQAVEEGPVPASELDLIRTSLRGEARTVDQQVRYTELMELKFEVFYKAAVLGQALKASHGVRGSVKKRAVVAFLRTDQIGMQIGTIQAREIAKHDWFQWGGAVFIGFNRQPEENEDELSTALTIVAALPGSVATRAAEEFGSRKLGEAFKATISDQDPESFLSLLLFACLIKTKPVEWEECARSRIQAIGRRSFYLSRMLNILLKDFKTGINTQRERESLKTLVGTIFAKRGFSKANPGAKLIREGTLQAERNGLFDDGIT